MRFPESLRWPRSAGGRESGGLVPTAKSVSRYERARERERRGRESKVAQILNQAQAEGVGFSRRGAHGSEADREVVGVGVALR